MPKTIVFLGPGASGKDYATEELCRLHGYTKCVSTTTRAPRPGEEKGQAYHFVTRAEFEAGIRVGEYLEYDEFGGNYYGLSKRSFRDENGIVILTPHGLAQLRKAKPHLPLHVVYLMVNENIRRDRLMIRMKEDKAQVQQRLDLDRRTFDGFSDYTMRIMRSDFTVLDLLDALAPEQTIQQTE